jgi:hypothetical protein
MKGTLTLMTVLCLAWHVPVFSQSGESKIEYQKSDKIAAILEMPYASDLVEDAIKDYMERKGAKSDRHKSFAVYRNTRINEDKNELCDVHCKVERKVEKNRESCVIYMLIGRPGENMAIRPADDRFKVSEAKELLNRMAPAIDAYKVDVEIKKQEDVVKKTEKKLLNLKDDQYDLEKRLKALQVKLEQNKNDQLVQNDELVRQKEALDSIQSKKQ